MIINGLDGEYTVTAEAMGNNGKTYSERLWIPGNQRKEITKQEMTTIFKTEEGKIIFRYLKKDQENKLQPKPKLDKSNLNNKLKEVENLVENRGLTENLKKDKTEESIRKYNDEYSKIVSKLNSVKDNISKLGEDKTSENESKLNQYIRELDNIKDSLNSLNNILKIKLDKNNLNLKLKEVQELINNKKLTEDKKKDKIEDSIKEYNAKLNEQISKFNNVNSEISKLGEEKTLQNEDKLNNYISDLNNIKDNLNNLDKILKDKPQPKPKLNKTNLNNKLKELEELVKDKELTENLKKDKTEESIRKYIEEYSKIVSNLNLVKDNISKLGEDKISENESKLNQYIRDLDNIKNSLGKLDNILKVKEEKIEKKVEFNNISSIKLFQNSPYGESWVTILENIPTNINDYFIKIESNNHRPIIIGVNKIEKVGNKYKIYGDNIEYILGENDLKSKDITKIKGYQNDKSNIYNNIIKLIPYYNLETVIEIGNKLNNSNILNNKKINSIISLKDKEVSSSEEVRNGLSNKVMIKFDDNTVEYYNLENLGKFKQFKEYNINLNGEKILYTPELGIENSKTKEVVNEIKQ